MPTYNGWNVVFIPAYPPAPASCKFGQVNAAAMNISPFTGNQQVQDWNATWMVGTVSLPAMPDIHAENWITFLRSLKGVVNVFQFSAAFMGKYAFLGNRYWRLRKNQSDWDLSDQRVFGITFDVMEAL